MGARGGGGVRGGSGGASRSAASVMSQQTRPTSIAAAMTAQGLNQASPKPTRTSRPRTKVEWDNNGDYLSTTINGYKMTATEWKGEYTLKVNKPIRGMIPRVYVPHASKTYKSMKSMNAGVRKFLKSGEL